MNIKEIQEKIDATEYWDMDILDLSVKYFGDEISIIIYKDDNTSWKIEFLSCYKLQYETDVTWRGFPHYVRVMKKPQMGYFGQNIAISQNKDHDDLIDVSLDLSIMTLEIICKEVKVEEVKNVDIIFFWKENEGRVDLA